MMEVLNWASNNPGLFILILIFVLAIFAGIIELAKSPFKGK